MKGSHLLEKEASSFDSNQPGGMGIISRVCEPTNSGVIWYLEVHGLKETYLEKAIFRLTLNFPINYPDYPPTLWCVSSTFHPNIYPNGKVCMSSLEPKNWDSGTQVWAILLGFQCLLEDPYPDVSANHSAAQLFLKDREEYRKHVLELAQAKILIAIPEDAPPIASSTSKLSSNDRFAITRLEAELLDLTNNPPCGILVGPDPEKSNMFIWNGFMTGPADTDLMDACFHFTLTFPVNFPFTSPSVRFTSKIFHPNISVNGKVSSEVLSMHWSPCYNLSSLLITLQCLLNEPISDSSYWSNRTAAELFFEDKAEYKRRLKTCARESQGLDQDEIWDEDEGGSELDSKEQNESRKQELRQLLKKRKEEETGNAAAGSSKLSRVQVTDEEAFLTYELKLTEAVLKVMHSRVEKLEAKGKPSDSEEENTTSNIPKQ